MSEMISVDEALQIFKDHGHTLGRTTLFYSIIGQHDTIPNVRGVKIGSRWMTFRANVEKAAAAWRGFPLFVSAAHKLVADEIDVDLPTFLMWRRTGRYGLVACKWKNRRGIVASSVPACIANFKAGNEWPNGEPVEKVEKPARRVNYVWSANA